MNFFTACSSMPKADGAIARRKHETRFVAASLIRQDGPARGREFFRSVRDKADAFEKARFLYDHDVTAKIAIVEFDAPDESRRMNLDAQNFTGGNDQGVEQAPALQLQPVRIDAIFLPEIFAGPFRDVNGRAVH